MKYRRLRKNVSPRIKALADAQKIAFAPLTFQAVAAALDFGILKFIDGKFVTVEEVIEACKISKYTAETILEVCVVADIVKKKNDKYSNTLLADALLNNEMTIKNFNFVKDVCYLGASELRSSFEKEEPIGLYKFVEKSDTIYPLIHKLPEQMKRSWFEFDHFYSDRCFDEVLEIIFKNPIKRIFDIGGNTGKFEIACLNFDSQVEVNMIDLPDNISVAKSNLSNERLNFYGIDVLAKDVKFPEISGAVFMSQFLDCFSEEQIIHILSNINSAMDLGTKIYILEPFTDIQQFDGASYSLVHISLYFTCMANGKSKMYPEKRMIELVEKSGLKVAKRYENIGVHDYTLLECVRA